MTDAESVDKGLARLYLQGIRWACVRIPSKESPGTSSACLPVAGRVELWRRVWRALLCARRNRAFDDWPESDSRAAMEIHRRYDDGDLDCFHSGGACRDQPEPLSKELRGELRFQQRIRPGDA